MSDRTDDNARLLAETFHDDWATGRAASFARTAATHARQRQRTRRALASAGAGVGLLTVVFLALRPLPRAPVAPAAVAPAPAVAARGYEIISDAELMTQLRDRSLLVVQKQNGAREYLLLANE